MLLMVAAAAAAADRLTSSVEANDVEVFVYLEYVCKRILVVITNDDQLTTRM